MSLSKLSESIITRAEKEAHDIIYEAHHHIDEAKRKEKENLASIKKDVNVEIKKTLEQYKKEKTLWAHLEGNRLIAEAKNKAVENALNEFKELLRKSRNTKEYKAFMKTKITSAISELSSIRNASKYVVHVLKGEKKLLPNLKNIKIIEDLDPSYIGGFIVEFEDGSVRVNMTLSELLNVKSTEIRGKIYLHLFKKKY